MLVDVIYIRRMGMKTNIYNSPELIEVIENDSLVYLFGTGISAALTGEDYSWKKWIRDGITFMRDRVRAEAYAKSLDRDDSTTNMVAVVGGVLRATKADGTYEAWMRTSFETHAVTNMELACILKKMLLMQDVFATTNYDLLLEQATGLGAWSYEEPDQAFAMLDRHLSTHVLHIHGRYESAAGVDNIIADQEQYDTLTANQGAQFIQGILGTRTVIFVGCGKTTEDANISRLIRFANEHLKMQQTYYFLYKTGDSVEGLPDNIVTIPYGDCYEDLPEFLDELAQCRIRNRVKQQVLIGRTAYDFRQSCVDPLFRYHYSQEATAFCGRQRELERLQEFVQTPQKVAWWSVTGQAGAGKSRLAFELLRRLPSTWFGFFVSDTASEKDVDRFEPFSNTFLVIDYVAGRERYVAELMRRMVKMYEQTPYMLRILLLEREDSRADGSWYRILRQRMGNYDRLAELEYTDQFLNLADLDEPAVDELIGCICQANGLEQDLKRDIWLRQAYGQKFEKLRYRPLFVQLFVEAWIGHDFTVPRYDSFEDVLAFILRREQERWLEVLDGDYALCDALIHLLLRANITGTLDVTKLPEYYQKDWEVVSDYIARHSFPGKQRTETRQTLLNFVCQNIDESNQLIAPLFPDLIKEYMFCFYAQEERLPDVMNEIWQNAAHDFAVFIERCLTDFPENEFYGRVLNVYRESTHACHVLAGRLELLKKWMLKPGDDPYVMLGIVENEYEFWRSITISEDMSSEEAEMLAALQVTGLNMVARQLGGWSAYDMSDVVAVAKEALEIPGGEAVRLIKQYQLQELIKELSVNGFMSEAAQLRDRMNELIREGGADEWNNYLSMINENAAMMGDLLQGDMWNAWQTLKKMNENCAYTSIEATRILAHAGFNFEQFTFLLEQKKYVGRGLAITQKLELLYPDDEEIRARRVGCQGTILQFRFFHEQALTKEQLADEIEPLKETLDELTYTNGPSDEALGMSWGLVNTLRLNVIDHDREELQKVIDAAEKILKINVHLTEVATTEISAVRAMYRHVWQKKVSHEEVERLFVYVEKNYESESLRSEFFELLDESVDVKNRENYLTKGVRMGAMQDAMYNPISGSGIDEFDEEEELYRMLTMYQPQETYRREHRKIGANEPCPCGSGRKYKHCCRRKEG